MTKAVIYTEREVDELKEEIPDKVHGLFKNRLGCKLGRLEVVAYAGKGQNNKHSWFAKCSCGSGFIRISSTGLVSTQSCGCYSRDVTSRVNKGNKSGTVHKKTAQTIEKMIKVKPMYTVTDQKDGKVMTKWDFECKDCGVEFSCRPDNIIPRGKSGKGQTPCGCHSGFGYSKHKPGAFYMLMIDDFCKFGISNDFDNRFKQLCKSFGSELEIYHILMARDGAMIANLESSIKSHFDYRVDVGEVDGKTEYRCRGDAEKIREYSIKYFTKYLKGELLDFLSTPGF